MRRLPLRSPPRVRGKGADACRCGDAGGITPAYAGKSVTRGTGVKPLWDHPRVCGEKAGGRHYVSHCEGSPPRMRGKDLPFTCDCESTGITPACAGKSLRPDNNPSTSWDHSRICGEKHPAFSVRHIFRGSPPRVRGKDCVRSLYVVLFWITPACAGKSRPKEAPAASDRDHPRVCGEKGVPHRGGTRCRGSPPRVRGKARAP